MEEKQGNHFSMLEKGLDSKRIKPEMQENIKNKAVNRRSKKSHSNVGVI